MNELIKNIEKAKGFDIKKLVEFSDGKVASLTLAETANTGITILALDEGEKLATHSASGDAMAVVLEGKAEIKIDGVKNEVAEGQMIVMPQNIPHSVLALTKYKMLLIVVK